MGHVMAHAESAIRRLIARLPDSHFATTLDDGTPLCIAIRTDPAQKSATIDFTGTGAQRPGNFNAPPSVTRAVVLYVFRCLAGVDMPLNDGCMAPLSIIIPPGTFLSPYPGAAVVAGNTEISQAVCNALLSALGAQAASQGTMNNFLFGTATTQYYETICGGSGGGPGFAGASAVHTHMTNTRMTDPEILELRYPVRLEHFSRRRDSGGAGKYPGGDGATRKIRFLAPLSAWIVASNRAAAPFGLAGGGAGAPGRQWIERADGRSDPFPCPGQADLRAGDSIVIETPGGGGFGPGNC
jgi:5-oxoprolinase (ATP-hydrolysing)